MYVIVTGNIADGFVVIGPFASEYDADEYLETLPNTNYTNAESVVMEVQSP